MKGNSKIKQMNSTRAEIMFIDQELEKKMKESISNNNNNNDNNKSKSNQMSSEKN